MTSDEDYVREIVGAKKIAKGDKLGIEAKKARLKEILAEDPSSMVRLPPIPPEIRKQIEDFWAGKGTIRYTSRSADTEVVHTYDGDRFEYRVGPAIDAGLEDGSYEP